jgi:sugar phosphate isomerase/epimerase
VGAPRVRVFGGVIPEGVSREQACDLLVNSLRSIAKEIAGLGVTVCVETHDDWCDPAHLAAVIRRVNHSAVAVNWDIMHPVRRGHKTVQEAFDTLKPWIRHVHFHDGITPEDGRLVFAPIGSGQVNHRTAVRLLKQDGYAGYLSGEWINWEPAAVHLPRELATMKQYEKEQ